MRVLHVITGLGSGGSERMLHRLVTRRWTEALEQTVISLTDGGIYGPDIAAAARLVTLDMTPGRPHPAAVLRLASWMRRIRPDVVVSWLYHADLIATVSSRLAARPPLVWNVRCSNMAFDRYARTTRWTVAALARLSGLPASICCNSEAGIQHHRSLGYHPRSWRLVDNGLDPEEYRPDPARRQAARADVAADADDVLIGMIARVDPMKDHRTFLAAVAGCAERMPGVKIRAVLIGRGTDGAEIGRLITKTGAADAIRLGESRQIPQVLCGLDGVVSASSFGEGFPNAILEAMACGVPVVATDVGDSARVLGETGLVVPPGDAAAMAGAIATLVEDGVEGRRRRGEAARQRVLARFTLEAVAGQYEAAWRDAAHPRHGR